MTNWGGLIHYMSGHSIEKSDLIEFINDQIEGSEQHMNYVSQIYNASRISDYFEYANLCQVKIILMLINEGGDIFIKNNDNVMPCNKFSTLFYRLLTNYFQIDKDTKTMGFLKGKNTKCAIK